MVGLAALALLLTVNQIQPDLSGVLSLRNKFGSGHGCPIGPEIALTAAHMVEPMPLAGDRKIFGGRYSDEIGGVGIYRVFYVSNLEDLALIKPDKPFVKWYPMASKPPVVDEVLYFLQYNWKNDELAYASMIVKAKVVRLSAGSIVFSDDAPKPGASGSCLLNSRGEVVGIIDSYTELENTDRVGSATGTWGEFAKAIEEVLKP